MSKQKTVLFNDIVIQLINDYKNKHEISFNKAVNNIILESLQQDSTLITILKNTEQLKTGMLKLNKAVKEINSI